VIPEPQVVQAAGPPQVATFSLGNDLTPGKALWQAEETLRTAAFDTPRLDAEVLLAHGLGISRAALLARLTEPLPAIARATYTDLINRRLRHEPIAYLTNRQAFYGLDFYVDRRVLIPRPETELLIERTIEIAAPRGYPGLRIADLPFTIHHSQINIADVGTGSGCIAVALAVHLRQAMIYAIEVSREAMEVARINIERHEVGDRVRLVASDLLRDLEAKIRFDIIVANLPYVSEPELAELPRSVWDYEPVEWALEAGPDGLDPIRRLLAQAHMRLNPGGVILLEIGAKQSTAASELARQRFPEATVRVLPDLAGLDRILEIYTREEP
jgi:release factor glutamine methyltransferase